jgi:cytochrome c553
MNLRFHRRDLIALIIFAVFVGIAFASFGDTFGGLGRSSASASGPSPSFTGAPLEANCTACHSTFKVNSGDGQVTISGLPKNYLAGQQIPLTVTVSDPSGVLYGFQMTGVDKNGRKIGEFILPTPSPSPAVPALQLVTGFVNGQERQYIEHTVQGITPTVAGSKTWQFNWTAPSRRAGKLSFYAAGNAANSDSSSDGDQIYTTSASVLSGTAIASFDGDQRSDFSVFRPSQGMWYSLNSTQAGYRQVQWGMAGDIPTPGDFDGDGITDRAVFRPSEGNWYLYRSSAGITGFPFGLNGDVPVVGDYDGDGRSDAAVWRPSNGTWYIAKSSGGYQINQFGLPNDIATHGDYDGDGKTDLAVFRPSEGSWYLWQSSDGFAFAQFGLSTDLPVQGDYDGDGRHDIAIFRPSNGQWWIARSTSGIGVFQFGGANDIPAPGDYDGDGSFDLTIFRPNEGNWYSLWSSDFLMRGTNWGLAGDIPVANAYLDR